MWNNHHGTWLFVRKSESLQQVLAASWQGRGHSVPFCVILAWTAQYELRNVMREKWLKSKFGVCAIGKESILFRKMTPIHERFKPLLDRFLV